VGRGRGERREGEGSGSETRVRSSDVCFPQLPCAVLDGEGFDEGVEGWCRHYTRTSIRLIGEGLENAPAYPGE
jgi:hypothetical protein